jgi:hypothetical protein
MEDVFASVRNSVELGDLPALEVIDNDLAMIVEDPQLQTQTNNTDARLDSSAHFSFSRRPRRWTRLPCFRVNQERHEMPPPRRGHTTTTLSHAQMLLFGGVGKAVDGVGNKLFNDTYLYIFGMTCCVSIRLFLLCFVLLCCVSFRFVSFYDYVVLFFVLSLFCEANS